MLLFLVLGLAELLVVITVYRLFQTYVLCAYKKRRYVIGEHTTILLTGDVSGIGRYLMLEFAKRNQCCLAVIDQNANKIENTMNELKKIGVKVHFFECDLREEEQIKSAVREAEKALGHIDIIINLGGASKQKLFTELSFEEIQMDFSYDFLAPVSVIKKIIPDMMERNIGHIVNISSLQSLMPSIGMTNSCAGKAALSGFHNALRLELKQQNKAILTTLVCVQNRKAQIEKQEGQLNQNLARQIYNSILEKREEVFIPVNWKLGALIIRALPTAVIDWLNKEKQSKLDEMGMQKAKDV